MRDLVLVIGFLGKPRRHAIIHERSMQNRLAADNHDES